MRYCNAVSGPHLDELAYLVHHMAPKTSSRNHGVQCYVDLTDDSCSTSDTQWGFAGSTTLFLVHTKMSWLPLCIICYLKQRLGTMFRSCPMLL